MQPTFFNFKSTRFGSLTVNLTSRQAAEAVFDEVDRITARWPRFNYPHAQVPVRWAKIQGPQELYPAHADYAFHLDGLPGSWTIPDEQHVFFKLPEDPYAAREEQRLKAQSRQRPDPEKWASAYQDGLAAGLDDEMDAISAAMAVDVYGALPEPLPLPAPLPPQGVPSEQSFMDHQALDFEHSNGHHRASRPSRGVHLKRAFRTSHNQVKCLLPMSTILMETLLDLDMHFGCKGLPDCTQRSQQPDSHLRIACCLNPISLFVFITCFASTCSHDNHQIVSILVMKCLDGRCMQCRGKTLSVENLLCIKSCICHTREATLCRRWKGATSARGLAQAMSMMGQSLSLAHLRTAPCLFACFRQSMMAMISHTEPPESTMSNGKMSIGSRTWRGG